MSGLCAIVRWDAVPMDPTMLDLMTDAAHHRGPARVHATSDAHLACQSSPDRTDAGLDHHGHLTVVASARIDNRDELLPLLSSYLETTDPSDAQVILAAHRRWGTEASLRLVGDYAYVVHDADRGALYAARDPMGMRPLYVHHSDRRTFVASEIQQIVATGAVPVELHEPAVARHLVGDFGQPDETCFRGVKALPAGHAFVADATGHQVRRYWDLDPDRVEHHANEADYADRFRELYLRAVGDRVRGAGTIGVLLSGGVDSGTIASVLGYLGERGAAPTPVHALSWAFDALPNCDERHLSQIVVERYRLQAHDVAADTLGPLAGYPDHGPHRDEPFIGAYQALFETALEVARAAGVTSVWSGDRGDLVCGNSVPNYATLVRWRRWRELLGALREHAAVSGEPLGTVVGQHVLWSSVRRVARRWLRPSSFRAPVPPDAPRPPWIRSDVLERLGVEDPGSRDPNDVVFASSGSAARHARRRLILAPNQMRGMTWSERTNAAFGLGFVDPWSDRRLAEFVVSIPQAVLNRPPGPSKRLARAAMGGIVPEEFRRNAAKIVPTPLYHHALQGPARPVVLELLTDMSADRRGWVDGGALRRHFDDYVAGGSLHGGFWNALTLEMWLRRYWS